jgi:predicted DNA binding CopG/RHH family protein
MKKPLKLPKFKNEDEERKFFERLDITEFFEPQDAKRPLFPNLKPTTRAISIRIPVYVINKIKAQANAQSVPYQVLMKQYLLESAFKK